MKLKYEFEYVEIGDEINAVPVGDNAGDFHGIIKVSESARAIMELLSSDTTTGSVTDGLARIYPETDRAELESAVAAFIEKLRAAGVLED